MEITVSNEIYQKLWDIMRKEGLDNSNQHIEYAIGKLVERWEAGRRDGGRENREYHYIHSSDLMMPRSSGPSNIFSVTRLMDTESWYRKEEMYWHTGWNPKVTLEWARKSNKSYAKLLSSLFRSGYNPELSQIIASGSQEGLTLLGGTHRLGYLLSLNANIFVPVKIFPTSFDIPAAEKEVSLSGTEDRPLEPNPSNLSYEWFHAQGVPFDRVESLRKRYEELVGKLRRNVVCMVEAAVFMARKKAVMKALKGVGRCIGVRMARAKIPKEKRMEMLDNMVLCPPPRRQTSHGNGRVCRSGCGAFLSGSILCRRTAGLLYGG